MTDNRDEKNIVIGENLVVDNTIELVKPIPVEELLERLPEDDDQLYKIVTIVAGRIEDKQKLKQLQNFLSMLT